jgi:hypothetical protein
MQFAELQRLRAILIDIGQPDAQKTAATGLRLRENLPYTRELESTRFAILLCRQANS